MAILTGGQVISGIVGPSFENADLELLGRARKVVVSKDKTTIVEGASDKDMIDGRIRQIRQEIENTDSDHDHEKLQERLTKLAGGAAAIKPGAVTKIELKERKHRIEDAIRNARAASEEGPVAGGDVALIQAADRALLALEGLISGKTAGANIVCIAVSSLPKQIAEDAGLGDDVVVDHVSPLEAGYGLSAATGGYGDLMAEGISDLVKVTRSALQNTASITGIFLTTETVVADKSESPTSAGGEDADMGGMY